MRSTHAPLYLLLQIFKWQIKYVRLNVNTISSAVLENGALSAMLKNMQVGTLLNR